MQLTVLIYALVAAGAPDAEAAKALDQAIAIVSNQEDNIASLAITYHSETGSLAAGRGKPRVSQRISYSEFRKGRKFRVTEKIVTDEGRTGVNLTDDSAYDGVQHRMYSAEERKGSISSAPGLDRAYLRFAYGSDLSLSEQLADAKSRGLAKWGMLKGRRVLVCETRESDGAERRIYLDPGHGWQPAFISLKTDVSPGTYSDGRTVEIASIESKSFLTEQDITLPSEFTLRVEGTGADGGVTYTFENRFRIDSIKINSGMTDESFLLVFPKGTEVVDADRDVVYTEGDPSSERPRRRSSATNVAQALTATGAQWIWWADYRVWLSAGLLSMVLLSLFKLRQMHQARA